MNDYKTIDILRKEYPNLDNYILSLTDIITKLETDKIDLAKRHIELENSLIELRKYHKEFEQFATTVYDPKKSTYKELEDKLKNFEVDKNREIDELWATKIKPLREKAEQLEKQLALVENSRQTAVDDLYESQIIPLKNQVKDRDIQLESKYKQEIRHGEQIRSLKSTIDNLNTIINYAVGCISACEQFREYHPQYVKLWLFKGVKDNHENFSNNSG